MRVLAQTGGFVFKVVIYLSLDLVVLYLDLVFPLLGSACLYYHHPFFLSTTRLTGLEKYKAECDTVSANKKSNLS